MQEQSVGDDSQNTDMLGSGLGTQELQSVGYEGSTVGTTVVHISSLSIRQVEYQLDALQVEGLVLKILFAEQDDPPDEEEVWLPR